MNEKAPRVFAICLILGSLLVLLRPFVASSPETRLLRRASTALARREWADAESFAKTVLESNPENPKALAIAGIAEAHQRRREAALKLLRRVPEDASPAGIAALNERGRVCLLLGQIVEAEACFRKVLAFAPDDLIAHRELAELLAFEGRCEEAAPHLLALVLAGRFRSDELQLLGIPQQIILQNSPLKDACEAVHPGSGLHKLGEAVLSLRDHKLDEVESLLAKLLPRFPELGMVQSLEGRLDLERDDIDRLLAWHQSLPTAASDHPEIWYVRALWAERSGQPPAAARCLLETLKTNPNHVEANYRLSQVFHQLGNAAMADKFSARSRRLSKLAYVINDLRENPDLRLLRQAAEELETLGCGWEALGWTQLAVETAEHQQVEQPWTQELWDRLRVRTIEEPARIFPELHPLAGIDLEEYPLPVWAALDQFQAPESEGADAAEALADLADIRFEDMAETAHLNYRYFNSMDPKVGLEHIFQTTGGGVAALDYDGDLWPDLYFAQGCPLPKTLAGFNAPQTQHLDRLFRNQGDGTFAEVASKAMLGDDRFSQGVTCGDFNDDGFPDIYVCNVGGNRFYENNGDGTFTEIARQTQTAGNEWSMSSLLADLDGDGFSDLYVANYLIAEQVLKRSCRKNGEPLTCAPTLFDPERDRVYRNLGDGRFEEITQTVGILENEGKSLGIIAMGDPNTGRLNVFIANDTTANQYYRNVTSKNGPLKFEESALLSGLAMSETGVMQACMGVAAGDSNADGLTDLFITNFISDYNTLYLQRPDGSFADESRVAKLKSPSVSMLGFGTQFLDANLDGRLDLLLTNGHVDQTFATGEPDVMPPQFFLNLGRTFQEAKPATLGPFFRKKFFGRGLVRLDWNRDGRDDACIVHLNAPVALLTNRTQTQNHWAAIRLKGVTSSRDAIGAKVTLRLNGRKLMRELTGGDGYQVCNERKLIFGLGNAETIQQVTVRWPTGRTQVFGPLPCDLEWLLIEGGACLALPTKPK